MTKHKRSTPGIDVALCGERPHHSAFSERKDQIDCATCLAKFAAGLARLKANVKARRKFSASFGH